MSNDINGIKKMFEDTYGPMIEKMTQESLIMGRRVGKTIMPSLTKKELEELIHSRSLMNNRTEYYTEMYLKRYTKLGKAMDKAGNG